MKSDQGDDGAATPDTISNTLDSILARFDTAIERLQQATAAEADLASEPEPEAEADAEIEAEAEPSVDTEPESTDEADVDTTDDSTEHTDTIELETLTAPQPDLELEVQPVTDATDVPEFVNPDLPDELDSSALVSIRGLTKHFDDTTAADNVSLDIRKGSIVGIVGPNGAGKTTTLSMVTGMLRPDRGSVLIAGHDIWKNPDEAKPHLGIVPDRMRVFDRLTGAQLLHYAGILRGLDADTVRARSTQLADTLGIADALSRLVDNYSSGMMKKLALATALIHAPKVLVLDEPFEAVDPVSVNTVVTLLREFAAAGGAVILSSHSLGLIQDLCDEVAVIVGGRVIAAGTVDDVRGDDSLENRFIALVRDDDDTAEDMEWLHDFSA